MFSISPSFILNRVLRTFFIANVVSLPWPVILALHLRLSSWPTSSASHPGQKLKFTRVFCVLEILRKHSRWKESNTTHLHVQFFNQYSSITLGFDDITWKIVSSVECIQEMNFDVFPARNKHYKENIITRSRITKVQIKYIKRKETKRHHWYVTSTNFASVTKCIRITLNYN